ncbi:CatB-related O-acetyltransferase [Rhizobium sp. L1K21]|uniref:CatB-related O-acetyltransferase n=1 Tax=Rhizobium sp. L1K21 TaxID=2954933 RepID=UPI002093261F|nr:CatB-related O-acetyltransferase [Rhizobium sp. L1K21]MCO6184946.1 CatB-related O-acetyltransferase [Rhizobium sp. L1K21]
MHLLNPDAVHPIMLPDGSVFTETVQLKNAIDHPCMEIGAFSYFTHSGKVEETASILAPYLYPFSRDTIKIGKFVQIARGSFFITSSANHPMAGFSTYPFRSFNLAETGGYPDLPFKDTIIGNDVWLGHNVTVMPGVTIGDGAIIAAGSVVTRDIAPYAIAGGNPAGVIRMRFEPNIVSRLLEIAWWNWPAEEIEQHFEILERADLSELEQLA